MFEERKRPPIAAGALLKFQLFLKIQKHGVAVKSFFHGIDRGIFELTTA